MLEVDRKDEEWMEILVTSLVLDKKKRAKADREEEKRKEKKRIREKVERKKYRMVSGRVTTDSTAKIC